MREFRIAVDINAPPDRVWAVMRDIERWPEWTPTVTSIQRLEGGHGPLSVGSRALVRQPKLPPAKWKLIDVDEEERSFTWMTRSPGVRLKARHRVEAKGDGSRATLSIQFSGLLGPLVALLTQKLNERYLDLEAKGLRERSEGATTSPPTGR